MRRLLILMLVFGLASVANAAIVISLDGDTVTDTITIVESTTVKVDLYNTDAADYGVFLAFFNASEGLFALSNPGLTANAGGMSSFGGPHDLIALGLGLDALAYDVTLATGPPPDTNIIGSQFEVDMHCAGVGTVVVQAIDLTSMAVLDQATINQIPEPATLVLLGLGGLLLRRRK